MNYQAQHSNVMIYMLFFLSVWLIDWLIGRKLGKKKQRFRLWRQKFLSGLSSIGLDVEEVSTMSMIKTKTNKKTCSSLGLDVKEVSIRLGIG